MKDDINALAWNLRKGVTGWQTTNIQGGRLPTLGQGYGVGIGLADTTCPPTSNSGRMKVRS